MANLISKMGLVSGFTMVSRLLGLGRDILTSAVFGTTIWNSAFITAFMLPNLFRRLLGEGALAAALMPQLTEELEENGREGAHALINKTLSWLLMVSLLLIAVAWTVFHAIIRFSASEKWVLVSELGIALFPYVSLICMAAVFAAALNLLDRFGVPALTAVWLNASIIGFLGLGGVYFGETLEEKMTYLVVGTMFGGALQLVVPAIALSREGWRPRFDLGLSPRLKELALLTLPGVYGAAAYQVNTAISRGLAYHVNDSGSSLIYYANRLTELPLGVFTIAVATVVFPALSRAALGKDKAPFSEIYRQGVTLSSMMALPAAIGLCLLGDSIIATLFQRGVFTSHDTAALAPVLFVFACGMPFYSFVSVETRAFFALKDTKTPVRAATLALVANAVLSVILMRQWEILGLAIASNIAVIAQCVFLHSRLRKARADVSLAPAIGKFGKIALSAACMGGFVYTIDRYAFPMLDLGSSTLDSLSVFGLVPLGVGVYFLLLRLLRMPMTG